MVLLKIVSLLFMGIIGTEGQEGCMRALGMESGAIPNAKVVASSMWDGNHAPGQGRLNFHETTHYSGAWAAKTNDGNQWLQIDLTSPGTRVTRVATQGRNYNVNWPPGTHSQWVTRYKLMYSEYGSKFQFYKEKGQANAKEFVGNTDRDTVVTHDLNPPIIARYIRFVPTAWHDHISMRVELYGCPLECLRVLGMENGAIPNNQISASSVWDNNHAPSQGRMNFHETTIKSGSWSAKTNDGNQWLQIDLGNLEEVVTRVATQGRNYNGNWPWGSHSQWVTKYTLQYSEDCKNFQEYKEGERDTVQEFDGNTDRDTIIGYDLIPPIFGRCIRFRPKAWHGHISMRVELYGC